MICPKCHGNGYWIDQMRVLRQVRQCDQCDSRGETEEEAPAARDTDE